MENSIAYNKSKCFAIRIVRLYKHLHDQMNEHVISRQLLRAGTSIGANLAEARHAMSRNDFLAKVYIALKECAETEYWLDLLHDTDYLSDPEHASIHSDCRELLRILTATTKTMSEDHRNS